MWPKNGKDTVRQARSLKLTTSPVIWNIIFECNEVVGVGPSETV